MHRFRLLFFVAAMSGLLGTASAADDTEHSKVQWLKGPATGKLGTTAEIKVPEGYMFAGADDTRAIMEAMHNPTTGAEQGFISPTNMEWFIVFEFSSTGYIKDDEKEKLDGDAMLKSIQKGTKEGNKERRKRGWSEITVVGWEVPPKYDEISHNLEWGTRAESEGLANVNYNTRLLGRRGVMSATLVSDPQHLAETLPLFKSLLRGFQYVGGETYAEYRSGDKIAAYGLTALVVGGGVAAAAKSGFLLKFWKVILVGLVAIGSFLKKFWSRITCRNVD